MKMQLQYRIVQREYSMYRLAR